MAAAPSFVWLFGDPKLTGRSVLSTCVRRTRKGDRMRKTLWRVAAIAAAASIWLAPSSAAQSRRPEDLVDAFVAAWNSHDVNAFERLFAADADWVTTYDVRDDGRANILADLKETHEGWAKSSTIVSSKVSVRVLRPDVAVVHFNAALTPTLGG